MFDISWTEFVLIGVVALIVIGPKELPGVLRTVGHWTRKVRVMATDFQNQFQEAMREAEMVDLKKQVDDLAQDIKGFDPLKSVREDVESAGKDIKRSLEAAPDAKAEPSAAGEPALTDAHAEAPAALSEVPLPPAAETPPPTESAEPRETESIGAVAETGAPEPAAETAQPDGPGRPA